MHVPFISDNTFYNNGISQENLFKLQSDAMRKAANESACVFVGRCADYVLRDHKNLVSVFITADLDERIAQVCKRHDCTADEARKIIEVGVPRSTTTIRARPGGTVPPTTSASTRRGLDSKAPRSS